MKIWLQCVTLWLTFLQFQTWSPWSLNPLQSYSAICQFLAKCKSDTAANKSTFMPFKVICHVSVKLIKVCEKTFFEGDRILAISIRGVFQTRTDFCSAAVCDALPAHFQTPECSEPRL